MTPLFKTKHADAELGRRGKCTSPRLLVTASPCLAFLILLLFLPALTALSAPKISKTSKTSNTLKTPKLPTAEWAISDAPFRVAVRLTSAPSSPEAGIEINLPECGLTRTDLGDLLLTDRTGTPLPLAKISNRPGGRAIVLAQKLEPSTQYFLYFGGDKLRACPEWTPKVSLLMETKPAPSSLKFDSLQDVKFAWAQSHEAPGAAFVPRIYHGGNPFGPNVRFLTHYSGYLRIPQAKEITFYTLSSDCSFVEVNDQGQFGWPGQHSPRANQQKVPQRAIQCLEGLLKIDYYAAKGDVPSDGFLEAAMVLGWKTESGYAPIPPDAWLHAGSTLVGPIQSADGQWLPTAKATVESFIGYVNEWLYETRFELRPAEAEAGWTATWEFEDGATVEGNSGKRVLTGRESQLVKCKLTRDGVTLNEIFRIDVPDQLQRASVNNPGEVQRYIAMILAEANNKLKPEAVRSRLAILCECGTDQDIAKFAEKWPERNQSDSLWVPSRLAVNHVHAQFDPAYARQEFRAIVQALPPNLLQIFAQEIVSTEMDMLVFCLRDPEAFGRLTQISFLNSPSSLARTAKIRIGDLHRLLGHYKEAAAQYQSLVTKDDSVGQPVKDGAASIDIRDLLEKGFAKNAQHKLNEWELRRPMAKFDSDFLLLHARTLLLLGRWSEALCELESFQSVQPDSPFQTDAQYYLARILYEKGNKSEAHKIWTAFVKDYPNHPLAPEAKAWAAKP